MFKIKQGDTVHVALQVVAVYGDGSMALEGATFGRSTIDGQTILIGSSQSIVNHIPKPVEPLKPQDRVQVKGDLYGPTGTLLAIYEGRAWVAWAGGTVPLSPLISNLERVIVP